jgi:predicted HicB family RNase H-like nuclease
MLHVRIPRDLRRQAKRRAADEEKTLSDVVADALRKHLVEQQQAAA